MTAFRAALVAAAFLALPATAHAGAVTSDGETITYVASAGGDNVTVGTDGGAPFVTSEDEAMTAQGGGCVATDTTRVECPAGAKKFVVRLTGDGNRIDGSQVLTAITLEAHGGSGADQLDGTPNADQLFGNDGGDTLTGDAGNDTLEGGAGANTFNDGAGNDTVVGGPSDDTWNAGSGSDTFTPGAGGDTVNYDGRSGGVTLTLRGGRDDGEPGENDDIGADAEDVNGGTGNDTIVGNDLGDRLHGHAGNDTVVGGAGEDRLEGQEGDDTIEARDGRYDSIDCGPGNDIVYGDPGDSTENCEVAPDVDGDGSLPPADCAPTNPAIHPGAGEIVGNAVDEDCKDGPLYLRVVSPVGYGTRARGSSIRFTRLVVTEVQAGDKIEVRCTTKKKGCPFTRKTVTGKAGKRSLNLVSMFKRRYLKRGAVVEIRVLRANQIGRVQRLTVARGKLTSRLLCLNVGARSPTRCV